MSEVLLYYQKEKKKKEGVKSVPITIRLPNLKPQFVVSSSFELETGCSKDYCSLPQEKEYAWIGFEAQPTAELSKCRKH